MAILVPPPPPAPIAADDDDRRERLNFRLWQLMMSTLTIMLAIWFCTFGPLPGILALVTAKHVLVAIFMMGLHRYPRYRGEVENPGPGR